MNTIQVYKWQNVDIQFDVVAGQLMANATAMCQAFNKRPVNWLDLPTTQRYISAIQAKSQNLTLIHTRRGGESPGTWIHEKLILKLAQWLDVEFEIQCDEWLSELHRTGKIELHPTTTSSTIMPDFSNPAEAARAWANEYEARILAEKEADTYLELARKNARKANYTDLVLLAENSWTTTSIAKELGMSASKLNRFLRELGIQFYRDGHWVLTARYDGKGYTDTRTALYTSKSGAQKTAIHTVWTETGRAFIHKQLNPVLGFTSPKTIDQKKQTINQG